MNHTATVLISQNKSQIAGVAFAAQGISQFGNFSEAFTLARVAAHDALIVINRKPGSPSETTYRSAKDDDLAVTVHSKKSKDKTEADVEEGDRIVKSILPKYEIDSTSDAGLKPKDIQGHITFKQVIFSYPTRPNETVLNGLSAEILPGQTVAFVGPRYDLDSRSCSYCPSPSLTLCTCNIVLLAVVVGRVLLLQ